MPEYSHPRQEAKADDSRIVIPLGQAGLILGWVFAFCAILVAVLFWQRPPVRPADKWAALALFLLSFLPALAGWWYSARTKVVMDSAGLWYSDWRQKAFLRWEEISDYSLFCYNDSSRSFMPQVTANGRTYKFLVPNFPALHARLKDTIQQRATRARATEWELYGARPFDEWPRVFDYRDENGCLLVATVFGLTGLLALLQISKAATYGGFIAVWNNVQLIWSSLSWPMRIAFVLMNLFLFAALPCLILAIRWPHIKATRPRVRETVTADLRGLLFESREERSFVPWERVLDYYDLPYQGGLQTLKRCVVATEKSEHVFLSSIQEAYLLRAIVKRYATNARATGWAMKEGSDTLEDFTPPLMNAALGSKTFHYRTRTNRAMLLLFSFFAALPIPGIVLGARFRTTGDFLFLGFYTLGLVLLMVLWRSHRKSWIELGNERVIVHGLFKTRALRWHDVRKITGTQGVYTLESATQKLRFWGLTSDSQTMLMEIRKRAPHAVYEDDTQEPQS